MGRQERQEAHDGRQGQQGQMGNNTWVSTLPAVSCASAAPLLAPPRETPAEGNCRSSGGGRKLQEALLPVCCYPMWPIRVSKRPSTTRRPSASPS
eukprot:11182514-Alexandrium_andersonii.AAC.1